MLTEWWSFYIQFYIPVPRNKYDKSTVLVLFAQRDLFCIIPRNLNFQLLIPVPRNKYDKDLVMQIKLTLTICYVGSWEPVGPDSNSVIYQNAWVAPVVCLSDRLSGIVHKLI